MKGKKEGKLPPKHETVIHTSQKYAKIGMTRWRKKKYISTEVTIPLQDRIRSTPLKRNKDWIKRWKQRPLIWSTISPHHFTRVFVPSVDIDVLLSWGLLSHSCYPPYCLSYPVWVKNDLKCECLQVRSFEVHHDRKKMWNTWHSVKRCHCYFRVASS